MGLYVLSPLDVSRIAQISIPSAYVFIHRLQQKNLIIPLMKGKFAISDDIFVIASQLIHPAYLSYSTALYLHGVYSQTINQIYVISSRKHRSPIKILDMEVHFIKVKPNHIFGYEKIDKQQSAVSVARIEKALVDGLYLPKYLNIGEISQILKEESFNLELIELYARQMQSEGVIRRLGYLLEQLGYKCTLKRSTASTYKLDPHNSEKGFFNSKWRLYVNVEV